MSADKDSHPFAIQLEVEFLDRLNEPVRDGRAKSVSAIIRAALDQFNLDNVVVVRPPQLTISVRLPAALRDSLKRTAREKHTSVGQLVRTAVEAYLPALEATAAEQFGLPIPYVEMPEEDAAPSAPAQLPVRRPKKRKAARKVKAASKKKKAPAQPRARGLPPAKRARPTKRKART